MDLNPLRILCKFKMQTKYPGDPVSELWIICLGHGSQIRASGYIPDWLPAGRGLGFFAAL